MMTTDVLTLEEQVVQDRLGMITSRQYQQLTYEHNKRSNMSRSAMKASVCRNTARKYINAGKSPVELKEPHSWRTRSDPFEEVWESEVVPFLETEPNLMAITLLEWLDAKYPGKYGSGQLRTLQRKIKQWRLLYGEEKEVFFAQVKEPGLSMEVDWTHMNELEICIGGEIYPHLLFHAVLPYSNWQWGMRCKSESYLSLQNGLQRVLGRLGAVPKQLWVDNSSTATHCLKRASKERGLNPAFVSLCEHFQMTPCVINVECPNENGDVESSHRHFKRRVDQLLKIRGHRNFKDYEEYDQFLDQMYERANKTLGEKLAQEISQMKKLPPTALPDWREYDCCVSRYAMIRLQNATYSVPTRLIGTCLRARVSEDQIRLFHGREQVLTLERRHWSQGAQVDYRHVIGQLIRKPGAFDQYRWRQSLFPTPIFESAFEQMEKARGRKWANREYLHILKLAAENGQNGVETALEQIMAANRAKMSLDEVKAILGSFDALRHQMQNQPPLAVNLITYDQLIGEEVACGF